MWPFIDNAKKDVNYTDHILINIQSIFSNLDLYNLRNKWDRKI